MANKSNHRLFGFSTLLLLFLILAGYAGNYFSYPFGFGVDFLFGSIATIIVISLYGFWWGTLASLIASFYTIVLWQHPYALIIFVCEALFVGWRIRRGKHNLLTTDTIFWICIGIPLVLLFYGYILQVGTVTTAIIALKQPVNGIFNTLIASLVLNYKPIYRWSNSTPRKATIYFEKILLDLLVAAVLIPALTLMLVNNKAAMKHQEDSLVATLNASAQNLAADLRRWHQTGLEALRFMAQTSSQSRIVVSGQTQHSLDLAVDSFPLFKETYIINADREVIAAASILNESQISQLDFARLELPRVPKIFVMPSSQNGSSSSPQILQTLPIILSDRWLGNIVAELNINFVEQLLAKEAHAVPLRSTLMDKNKLLIASTDEEYKQQQIFSRPEGKIKAIESSNSQPNVYHWLPIMEGKPLIARWRKSFYAEEIAIDEEIPLVLCMEAPATPFIDYLQLLYIRSLAILLAIAIASILIARYLSRLLVGPILRLTAFTTNIPSKILRNETISIPRSSIIEMNALVDNFETMAEAIEENFSQIKLTNKKLRRAKDKSEVANKTKDKFLANISHELKTPLNSIIGYSKLGQKKLNLQHAQIGNFEAIKSLEWLETIQQDGKYLLTLINEILDLAKSQARKTKLYPSLINVSSFTEDIVLTGRRKAKEKNIAFKFEIVGKLPLNIYADEQRLRQVLLNLLDNAIKYTERGQIVFQISNIDCHRQESLTGDTTLLLENSPERVCLRFKVADTGIGIERQNLSRIFQPFEQVDKYEVPEVGTGLGLSISQQLVKLMGSELQVKSEFGKGSIFWFDLVCPEIKVSSTIEAQSVKEIIGYKGDRQTVLIVDDVKTSRLLLQDILEPLGFRVIVAKNGQHGLQLAIDNRPNLILTDLFMPIKTGFSLIAELRQIDSFDRTPILAISASSFEEVEKQSRASGCNGFLEKPIDDRKLLNALGKHLNLEWIYQYSQSKNRQL